MNKDKQEIKEKEYIALRKERDELLRQLRQAEVVQVEPYQDGWIVSIDFRDDVKHRDDFAGLKEAFDACSSELHTKNVKLVQHVRRHGDLPRNHIYWSGPGFKLIDKKTLDGLSPAAAKYFSLEYSKRGAFDLGERYYIQLPPHLTCMKTKKNIVTEEKVIDLSVKARIDEIYRLCAPFEYGGGWKNKFYRKLHNSKIRGAERRVTRDIMKGDDEVEVPKIKD